MVATSLSSSNIFVSYHQDPPDTLAPQKYYKDYKKLQLRDLSSLSRLIQQVVWSDCLWKGGRRAEANFIASYLAVADVDNGFSMEQAKKLVCDQPHIIATTKSHGIKGERYRVVVPFEREITDIETYRYNCQRFLERFDGDQQCFDGARFYWPCRELISCSNEGIKEGVASLPENHLSKLQREIDRATRHIDNPKILPAWIRETLRRGAKEGFRNNNVYAIAKTLTYQGLKEQEIVDIIMRSPIGLPLKEVQNAVRSGRKKADQIIRAKEEDEGRRKGPDGGSLRRNSLSDEPGPILPTS